MDFVWVFPLILAFISIGQIHTEWTVQSPKICKKCDAGHYKIGDCSNGKYNCKKCEENTFTAIENTLGECIRCTPCRSNEVEIQSCSFDHDAKCDCKDHNYYHGSGHSKYCMQCPDPSDSSVRSCEKNPDCKRKCIAAITNTTSSPTISTDNGKRSSTISTDNGKRSSTSNPAEDPVIDPVPKNHMLWLFYVVVLLVVVVFFGLVLLLTWIHSEKPNMCARWATNNCVEPHAEDSKFSEHCSHQDSSPTTLTINISEETPMMPLNNSPITPEHPAHIAPLLPNSAQKGAKQDEQSEQWPAIVLYAIIKEVPLRRWKEFLRLLSVADQQLDRVELEAGLGQGSIERQYQMLRLWSQRPTASLNDVFSALHYMDLSGCAQLLQDSLEKLQWRPATMQDT